MRNLKRSLMGLAAAGLFVLSTTPASAVTRIVDGLATRWSPAAVSIARGASVKWHAIAGDHNVKAYGGNWHYFKVMDQGDTTPAKRFNTAGIFRFYCTIHGHVSHGTCTGMCGKITVHAATLSTARLPTGRGRS